MFHIHVVLLLPCDYYPLFHLLHQPTLLPSDLSFPHTSKFKLGNRTYLFSNRE